MVLIKTIGYSRVVLRIPVECWKCCVDNSMICGSIVVVSWEGLVDYDVEQVYSLEYKALVGLVREVFKRIISDHECIIAEDLASMLHSKLVEALYEKGVKPRLYLGRIKLALEFYEPLGNGEKIPVRVEA